MGQVENPTIADSVRDVGRTAILMAAVGMYGPGVTHKRPACVCSCSAGNQKDIKEMKIVMFTK